MPKLPAIVAMIMQLVKVRRDLSSAFVNLASVGMDKIAQVTELLRTTIYFSPSQKQFKQRPGVLVLVVKKPAQLISQFLIKFKLPFNIQIIHLLSLNKSIYIYIYIYIYCFVFVLFFAHRTVASGRSFTFNNTPGIHVASLIFLCWIQTPNIFFPAIQ